MVVRGGLLIPTLGLVILSFSDFIVRDIGKYQSGVQLQFKQGPLFGAYAAYTILYLLGTYLILYLRWRASQGIDRNRIAYVFFGITSATVIAALVNLFISQQFLLPTAVSRVGVYGGLLLAGSVAIAIVRHQLMDIEVIIRRTVVFAGLAGSVVAVVSLMAFVTQDLLGQFIGISRVWSNIFAAMIIAALYGPIRNWLVNATDKYLFQKKYDYRDLLRKLMDEVMTVLDLKKLMGLTTQTLSETIKLDSCALLLPSRVTNRYEVVAAVGKVERNVALEETHPLVRYLHQTQEPVVKDPSRKDHETPMKAVEETLARLKAEVCLPLAMRADLVGILALGHKKSDEPYTKEDLDILMTLAKTLAIAVSNAQLAAEAAQQEKLAVIGTLAAAINHEVCNPLNNVKVEAEGFLLQLRRGLMKDLSREALEEKVSWIMEHTMSEIDRTAAITTRLSNFAKPVREPVTEPVELRKVVQEVSSLLGHDLELREIALETDVPADIPPLLVDHRQLQEILFNLVRNAGQAIGQKGTVTVRACRNGDSMVDIEVIDTGPGIPPEILQRLFTPFFTTKGEGKGTGVGLFVIKRLVERNEGTLSVRSEVGKGTAFLLEFPAALKAAEERVPGL